MLALIIAAGLAGYGCSGLKLPAAYLIGGMLVSIAAHVSGAGERLCDVVLVAQRLFVSLGALIGSAGFWRQPGPNFATCFSVPVCMVTSAGVRVSGPAHLAVLGATGSRAGSDRHYWWHSRPAARNHGAIVGHSRAFDPTFGCHPSCGAIVDADGDLCHFFGLRAVANRSADCFFANCAILLRGHLHYVEKESEMDKEWGGNAERDQRRGFWPN